VAGLYLHVPFCRRKCAYCDFYSLPGREDAQAAYVGAVLAEGETYRGMAFDTLYLGGGTPSLLGSTHLAELMAGLRRLFVLDSLAEATIEANPESASPDFLAAARAAGFNRLSLGVQSLNDAELCAAGRLHSAAGALGALAAARAAGFTDISADLIAGLPGQTAVSLRYSLTALAPQVSHLSLYLLSLEPDTPLARRPPANLPSDDAQADLFGEAVPLLGKLGFTYYEISNFARPGHECRHNLNYWRGGEYLGLGPAAASHLSGRRFRNRPDLDAYLAAPTLQNVDPEALSSPEKAAEEAMLRLRLIAEGLAPEDLAARFGERAVRPLRRRLAALAREGRLSEAAGRYRLAPDAILTANQIFRRILAD